MVVLRSGNFRCTLPTLCEMWFMLQLGAVRVIPTFHLIYGNNQTFFSLAAPVLL